MPNIFVRTIRCFDQSTPPVASIHQFVEPRIEADSNLEPERFSLASFREEVEQNADQNVACAALTSPITTLAEFNAILQWSNSDGVRRFHHFAHKFETADFHFVDNDYIYGAEGQFKI